MSGRECWCDLYDEITSTSVRCMTRALDLGCCGGALGRCRCEPTGEIRLRVAVYAREHPGVLA